MIPPDTSFGCSSCGRNFTTKANLDRHMDGSGHRYGCALCRTHYDDVNAFRQHLDLAHLGYSCTVGACPHWAATEAEVVQHLQGHTEYTAGTQTTRNAFKPRKFGTPEGPDYLRYSTRKPPAHGTRLSADQNAKEYVSPLTYQSVYPKKSIPWNRLAGFLHKRFPGETFEERQVGDNWVFSTPELLTKADLHELAAISALDLIPPWRKRPSPHSAVSGTQYGPLFAKIKCPFRASLEASANTRYRHALCRTTHAEMSSLIIHLRSIHHLVVTHQTLSSFHAKPTVPPLQKAGVCRNCWQIFATEADMFSHLQRSPRPRFACKSSTLRGVDIEGVLHEAFVGPLGGVEVSGRDGDPGREPTIGATADCTQAVTDTLKPPATGLSSDLPVQDPHKHLGKNQYPVAQASKDENDAGLRQSSYSRCEIGDSINPVDAIINHTASSRGSSAQPGQDHSLDRGVVAPGTPLSHPFDQTLTGSDRASKPTPPVGGFAPHVESTSAQGKQDFTVDADIDLEMVHLGLFVSERSVHSFAIDTTNQSIPRCGVCRRCLTVFTDQGDFKSHLLNQCEHVAKSHRERWQVLREAFTPRNRGGTRTAKGQPVAKGGLTVEPTTPGQGVPVKGNSLFAQRLKALNYRHMNPKHVPETFPGSSPFLKGSPLAPEPATDVLENVPLELGVTRRVQHTHGGSSALPDFPSQRSSIHYVLNDSPVMSTTYETSMQSGHDEQYPFHAFMRSSLSGSSNLDGPPDAPQSKAQVPLNDGKTAAATRGDQHQPPWTTLHPLILPPISNSTKQLSAPRMGSMTSPTSDMDPSLQTIPPPKLATALPPIHKPIATDDTLHPADLTEDPEIEVPDRVPQLHTPALDGGASKPILLPRQGDASNTHATKEQVLGSSSLNPTVIYNIRIEQRELPSDSLPQSPEKRLESPETEPMELAEAGTSTAAIAETVAATAAVLSFQRHDGQVVVDEVNRWALGEAYVPQTVAYNDQNNAGSQSIDKDVHPQRWHGSSSSDGPSESWSVSRHGLQPVAAQTDSGYASLPRDKERVLRHDTQDQEETTQEETLGDGEASDIDTVYSDDRSQASLSRTQRYISEFVDHLYGKIKHLLQVWGEQRIQDCLPELLQAFALKVGQSSSTRGHLEVMYFVHKHRRAIALFLQSRLEEDEMHGSAEIGDGDADVAGMSLADKLSLWDQKASVVEAEKAMVGPHECDDDDPMEIEPLEDEIDIQDLDRYQSLITGSTAFEWLVGSLQRELQLDNTASAGMTFIRRRILQGLPTPRHISRNKAVPSVQVTFTAPWDPVSFIQEQGYDPATEDLLGKVITVTGSSEDVQATTCKEYLCQTWPSTGKYILRIIEDTLCSSVTGSSIPPERRTYIMPDNTRIAATCADQHLTLEASGTAYSVAEIGEQLGWLISALRSSGNESSLSFFCPTVERFERGFDSTQLFHCHISTSRIGASPTGSQVRNGECWHRLFVNPAVVWGYPVPRRQDLVAGTGLEIPLDMLVAMTDADGVSEFDHRAYIKGYSAMLVPTQQKDNLIMWHLLLNEDGSRISYTDCRLEALEHIRPTGLKQARHILGWVSQARNNTGSATANYDIKWSGLGKPRERHAWEKVVISGGDSVGVSASFVIGKKDKGVFAGALGGYASRLKFIAKQYVVMYDLDDRRAWLVDGLSALLHLVRASLEHDQKDVFKPYFLYNQGQLEECAATMHGSGAAAAVLFNPDNCSLRLYTESEDTWDEESEQLKHGAHGSKIVKEVISKRRVTYYCLRDRVLEIFGTLEKMIDHLNNVQSETGVGFRLRGTPRNILEGFDFMDVATSNAPIRPHLIKLNICESGRGWTDLLRSLQGITLFGRGFGELIAPVTDSPLGQSCGGCGYGVSLPTGKDYLGTCVDLIERILTTRGSTETVPWCLADDIYWHTPGPLFDPCRCASNGKAGDPNGRVQVLVPSTFGPKLWGRSFASPSELQTEGAIMFSHNWRLPFRLGHHSSYEMKIPEPPDSGLGTSIDSSSARSQLSGSLDDSGTQVSGDADGSSARSVASLTEAASIPGGVESNIGPGTGDTGGRKRKLVDMVDRVKKKVLKTSTSMELQGLTGGGNGGP